LKSLETPRTQGTSSKN